MAVKDTTKSMTSGSPYRLILAFAMMISPVLSDMRFFACNDIVKKGG